MSNEMATIEWYLKLAKQAEDLGLEIDSSAGFTVTTDIDKKYVALSLENLQGFLQGFEYGDNRRDQRKTDVADAMAYIKDNKLDKAIEILERIISHG